MSFKAYIENVEKATGKSIAELTEIALDKGFVSDDGVLKSDVKAGTIVSWLKEDLGLGHGHAMSVVAYFKGKRE
jgi:hypothetical protein